MLHMTKRKSIYILQRNVKVLGGSVDMVSKGRRGWAGWVYFITAMTQTQQHARCALVFHSDPLQAWDHLTFQCGLGLLCSSCPLFTTSVCILESRVWSKVGAPRSLRTQLPTIQWKHQQSWLLTVKGFEKFWGFVVLKPPQKQFSFCLWQFSSSWLARLITPQYFWLPWQQPVTHTNTSSKGSL